MPNLKRLYFNHPTPWEGLRDLKKFPALEYLEIANMDPPRMDFLERPPRLQTLSFTDDGDFLPKDMANLSRFNGLTAFHSSYSLTDAGVVHLKSIKTLKRIHLASTMKTYDYAITDIALAHLKEIPSLESVVLEYGLFTAWGLDQLSELPNLKRLYLLNAHSINENGLATLARLQHLEELYLRGDYGDPILEKTVFYTDRSLDALGQFPSLRKLVFFFRGQITDEGIARLKSKKPDLKVFFHYDLLRERSRQRRAKLKSD